ncbi:MAG: bifunctional proline dehydrogenase/L-glutamate gamma-semialdehyde dehydrogenase [Bacteriovoracaceae bacterium]|nr:bifunctional proline dehydrogenase/L-glutamate gamma-semialdehyde dehydrogenase [Bacteriovoracaceae bacterium]
MNTEILSGVFSSFVHVQFNDWSVIFSADFKNQLLISGDGNVLSTEVVDKLQQYTKNLQDDFRVQLNFKTVPFLVAFFPNDKKIRFYTPRLHNELFFLQHTSGLNEFAEVELLKKHVDPVLQQKLKSFPTESEVITRNEALVDLASLKSIDERAEVLVKELLVHVNSYRPSFFEKVSDFALGLTAQYALLRIHLLKFLAILPSLDHDKRGVEVKRILLEALKRFLNDNKKARHAKKKGQERSLPNDLTWLLTIAYQLSKILPAGPLAAIVRFKVRFMAKRFIAGETIELADSSLRSLFQTGRDVTLDQLGELVVSEKEADHYMEEVLKLIRGFSLHVKKGELNGAGISRAHVSIKVSALSSDFKPHAPEYTYNLVAPRLKKILLTAKEHQVFINIDAEHYHYRDIVFEIYKRLLLETSELKDYADTGIVLQAYLRDGAKHLREIIDLAKERKLSMPVRIVKGAYWDAETVEGDAHGFNAPQFLNKEETDIHFRQLVVEILKAHQHLKLCLASHNFSDHAFAEAVREKLYPEAFAIEHQCLHMTYEALSTALAKKKWVVRNYVPVGSLLVGMAYLVRRIMENSSQVGVLTIMRSHKKQTSLVSPLQIHYDKKEKGLIARDISQTNLNEDFFNVSPVRLYLKPELQEMISALSTFKEKSLGKAYELNHLSKDNTVKIFSSSNETLLVGTIPFASVEDTDRALSIVDKEFQEGNSWTTLPWQLRAKALMRASEIMLSRRLELSALIIFEAGKSVNEALGDVDEAIDFLTFYARTEGYLQTHFNNLISRGPVAVIAPWNFPLAIPCGMVAGALVAGNTVILKSAEQTPLIAEELAQIFYTAGIPKEAFIHLPGMGETVGDKLVKDQRISTIIFTGSKAVGTYIHKEVQKRLYTNKRFNKTYPVKAITEMGGKNAIIVTQNAELDETVSGILASAFGHAGQKCSACSRVIVHHSLKDKLIERLKAAAMDLSVGSALDFQTTVNPLVSADDKARVRRMVEEASVEAKKYGGKTILVRATENHPGHAVGPSIIELPYERALNAESVSQQEIFGPVIHVMGFHELDDAIKLFNATDYALTGGVFSQSQDDLDYLIERLECGNLYINRTITGARVGIEPFGGFKLSGTGPKAGGRHYIHALHQTDFKIQETLVSKIEEGSGYQVQLAKPSRLSYVMKEERTLKFLNDFLNTYESLVGDIRSGEKEVIKNFDKWVQKNYLNFFTKEHDNRKIPGQISVNSHLQHADTMVVVAVNPRAHIKSILQVLVAISTGVGVSIMARNNQSYQFWMGIKDLLLKSGFSKENVDVYFVNEDNFKKTLSHTSLTHVLYDGPIDQMAKDVIDHLHAQKERRRLVHLLTVQDSFDLTDFYQIYLKFVHVRSLAVNTMRHGAPLDLDL